MTRLLISLFISIVITSCASKKAIKAELCGQDFEKVTVVNRTGLDGCGYMLMRADSSAFEVNNLPDSLKVEGKVLCIKYQVAKRQMSVCMSGQKIDLLEIQK